ncbi:SMP-30/gluconolactonase/LRE family protein [Candidatus Saccharibacteria bacterium TM7i]|nr:SMP-30/gluconolactonase/LRE family protein [Candidatus Saccharibacteria bacterium TM7i]
MFGGHMRKTSLQGFTIVELLIVIVVIAVLATITIVSYNGIQVQAHTSALKSDARTAMSFMETDRVTRGAYTTDPNMLNAGSGLPVNSDRSFAFYSDGTAYCISVHSTRVSTTFYVSNEQPSPKEGLCPQDSGASVASLAGNGSLGYANGSGEAAVLASPVALSSSSGNVLYFTDSSTSRVRQVTTAGVVSTIAGNGPTGTTEGVGNAALFNWPQAVTIGFNGHLYVADSNNQRIRTVPLNNTSTSVFAGLTGTSTTTGFAEGTGTAARFNVPRGIAFDSNNNLLYVADSQNNRVRRITAGQVVDTLAGQSGGGFVDNTTGTLAQFNYPQGLAVSTNGTIYVADTNNHRIRMITPSGSVSTLAGGLQGNVDNDGTAARFNKPSAVAVSANGTVYVTDTDNHSIRKITPAGKVSTIAGNGMAGYANGNGSDARFNAPRGIALGSDGRLYVADTGNHRIRVLTNL